jgi:NAD(P)-dependent dehydrogenase (short-subunit alcohol dehydrogenase family)
MSTPSGRLAGKVAIITGTGAGQGRAAALRFAREGASVVGCDLNEADALETVRLVNAAGGRMISLHPFDIANEEGHVRLVETAESEFGRLDILYNNAAWTRPGHARTMSLDDFRSSFDGTVTMYWLLARAAVAAMERHGGGSIVNISSIAGLPVGTSALGNSTFMFAYGIGKAAVIKMTQLLAIELAQFGIRCNAISPGTIDTPGVSRMIGEPGSPLRQAIIEESLVHRLGTSDDVVNAALFLSSDESSFITGHNLVVDGGWAVSGGGGRPNAVASELYRTGKQAASEETSA